MEFRCVYLGHLIAISEEHTRVGLVGLVETIPRESGDREEAQRVEREIENERTKVDEPCCIEKCYKRNRHRHRYNFLDIFIKKQTTKNAQVNLINIK